MTFLDVAWPPADHHGAVGVVHQEVADGAQDGTSHFAHAPCARHDHGRILLFGHTADDLAGFPCGCTQNTWNLHTRSKDAFQGEIFPDAVIKMSNS